MGGLSLPYTKIIWNLTLHVVEQFCSTTSVNITHMPYISPVTTVYNDGVKIVILLIICVFSISRVPNFARVPLNSNAQEQLFPTASSLWENGRFLRSCHNKWLLLNITGSGSSRLTWTLSGRHGTVMALDFRQSTDRNIMLGNLEQSSPIF